LKKLKAKHSASLKHIQKDVLFLFK
jgi:hypothetical protein